MQRRKYSRRQERCLGDASTMRFGIDENREDQTVREESFIPRIVEMQRATRNMFTVDLHARRSPPLGDRNLRSETSSSGDVARDRDPTNAVGAVIISAVVAAQSPELHVALYERSSPTSFHSSPHLRLRYQKYILRDDRARTMTNAIVAR